MPFSLWFTLLYMFLGREAPINANGYDYRAHFVHAAMIDSTGSVSYTATRICTTATYIGNCPTQTVLLEGLQSGFCAVFEFPGDSTEIWYGWEVGNPRTLHHETVTNYAVQDTLPILEALASGDSTGRTRSWAVGLGTGGVHVSVDDSSHNIWRFAIRVAQDVNNPTRGEIGVLSAPWRALPTPAPPKYRPARKRPYVEPVDSGLVESRPGPYTFEGHTGIDLGDVQIQGDKLTIEATIYIDTLAVVDGRIISKATGPYEQDHVWMLSTYTNYALRGRLRTVRDGVATTRTLISAPGVLQQRRWHQVRMTFDGSTGAWVLFVEGAEVAAGSGLFGTLDVGAGVAAAIGNQPEGASGIWDQGFRGAIQDVRIWKVVR